MTEPLHYVRQKGSATRNSLAKAARAGGVTLVLGAGVSIARGLPSWPQLVHRLWSDLSPPRPVPEWLRDDKPLPHPLAYQILMEEIEGASRWEIGQRKNISADDVDPRQVRDLIVEKISRLLYEKMPSENPDDTLGVLIELLRREQQAPDRRILRVITFNADDLLERGANRDTDAGKEPVLFPVPRASLHPRYGECAFGKPPINVFHLHGFIPFSQRYTRGAEDTLVFTDAEYWESVANPSSFANRVMTNALQDSKCIFVGMSMTDVNLMRWLGLMFNEFMADRRAHYAYAGKSPAYAHKMARKALGRHFWICTRGDDPSRLIASHLERRGVKTVTLSGWGQPFSDLVHSCFDRDD